MYRDAWAFREVPPSASGLVLSPSNPTTSQAVTATAQGVTGGYKVLSYLYHWYVNGNLQTIPPYALKLEPHQEIAIVIGKPPATIPSTYNWTGL